MLRLRKTTPGQGKGNELVFGMCTETLGFNPNGSDEEKRIFFEKLRMLFNRLGKKFKCTLAVGKFCIIIDTSEDEEKAEKIEKALIRAFLK